MTISALKLLDECNKLRDRVSIYRSSVNTHTVRPSSLTLSAIDSSHFTHRTACKGNLPKNLNIHRTFKSNNIPDTAGTNDKGFFRSSLRARLDLRLNSCGYLCMGGVQLNPKVLLIIL